MGSVPPRLPLYNKSIRKSPVSRSDAMRRHRVVSPQQCRDAGEKMRNLRNLMAATNREYRSMIANLDRLDNEGRAWLIVDLIHTTALSTLDLCSDLLTVASGERAAKPISTLATGTRTASEAITQIGNISNGTATRVGLVESVLSRVLAHTSPSSPGGSYAHGSADIALTGAQGVRNIADANGSGAQGARATEAAIELGSAMIQRSASTVGGPVAERVGAAAGVTRSMASIRRDYDAVFDRRLEIRSELMQQKYMLEATLQRDMQRFSKQAAEIEALLSACM